MTEKTLGQILESIFHTIPKLSNSNDWERAAKEFIAEHESRKWQPIESKDVPKDGITEVLLYDATVHDINAKNVYKGYYNRLMQEWVTDKDCAVVTLKPTFWQPLPAPPKQEGES